MDQREAPVSEEAEVVEVVLGGSHRVDRDLSEPEGIRSLLAQLPLNPSPTL